MVVFWYPKDFNQHEIHAEDLEDGSTLLHVTDVEGGKHKIQVETEAYKRWTSGDLIHRCFPQLTADERELLISGFTSKVWEEVIGSEDEM